MATQSTSHPTKQELFIAKRTVFAMIDDKNHTAYDFGKMLMKYKKYFTPKNLVSEEGLNILQTATDNGRLAYLVPIIYTGWWIPLCSHKVPETSLSEHRGKTAKQIAETKRARKALDEFNSTNEWENSLSPLMKSCRSGDTSKARYLLNNQGDGIFHNDYNHGNALFWALINGDLELFNELVTFGLDINMRTKKNESLLHIACSIGQHQFVSCLIRKYNIDAHLEDINHKTALERVAENGDIETLKEFLKCEVPLPPSLLPICAFTGRLNFLKYLVENDHMHVDSADLYGRTALHRASEGGKVDIAKYMVSKGAKLDLHTKMNRNILHITAEQGSLVLMIWFITTLKSKKLLERLINIQDRYNGVDLCFLIRGRDKGRDAYHYVEVMRYKVPIFLKKTKSGNVDVALYGKVIKSDWGVNPSPEAVDEIEELFKRRRLDVNAPADMTPLHIAIAKGHSEIAKLFIQEGAMVNIADKFGLSPLHLAASKGDLEVIALLEKTGADFKAVSKDGKTVAEIADENECDEVVNFTNGRDSHQLTENFLHGPLRNTEAALSHERLDEVRRQGGDTRKHMVDTLRGLRIDINQLLVDLGSGPVLEATRDTEKPLPLPGSTPGQPPAPIAHDSGIYSQSMSSSTLTHQLDSMTIGNNQTTLRQPVSKSYPVPMHQPSLMNSATSSGYGSDMSSSNHRLKQQPFTDGAKQHVHMQNQSIRSPQFAAANLTDKK